MIKRRLSKRINRLLGGEPELTLSAEVYLKSHTSKKFDKLRKLLDFLFLVFLREQQHCRKSFLWMEQVRRYYIKETK